MSACLALEQTLRVAYLGPAGNVQPRGRRQALRQLRRMRCRARRSTTCSARSRAGRPTTRSCRSRTRPRARSAARSISCADDRSVDLRRGQAARPAEPAVECAARSATVTSVYSHAQSLAQCVQWLAQHLPGVPRIAVASNAEAARLAAAEAGRRRDRRRERGARSTDSRSLAPHIEDEPNNTTRFWVLGRQQVAAVGPRRDVARDVGPEPAGRACYSLLEPFAKHGVSMTRFESRPARTGLLGVPVLRRLRRPSQTTPPVAAALAELATTRAVPEAAGLVSCGAGLGAT